RAHRALPSFPTRRSSDLHRPGSAPVSIREHLDHKAAVRLGLAFLPLKLLAQPLARERCARTEERLYVLVCDDLQHEVDVVRRRRSEEHTSELQSLAYLVC